MTYGKLFLLSLPILFLGSCASSGLGDRSLSSGERDCRNPLDTSQPVLLRSDLNFEQTPLMMKEKFDWVLKTGRRIEYRGYKEGDRYLLPIYSDNRTGMRQPQALVSFPQKTAKAVVVHMETAFKKGYAIYPFFSDMGHGHLMLPDGEAAKIGLLSNGKESSDAERLEAILSHPELKILYHAAEQLKYSEKGKPIKELDFLRKHRNIIGSIARPTELETVDLGGVPNTAGAPKGMSTVGMFYMSAANRACIPIRYGKGSLFLDFSFMGSSYDPKQMVDEE